MGLGTSWGIFCGLTFELSCCEAVSSNEGLGGMVNEGRGL